MEGESWRKGKAWNPERGIVLRAAEEGLDTEGGPWVVLCDEHKTLCNFRTRAEARTVAAELPLDFCEDCVSAATNHGVPTPYFMGLDKYAPGEQAAYYLIVAQAAQQNANLPCSKCFVKAPDVKRRYLRTERNGTLVRAFFAPRQCRACFDGGKWTAIELFAEVVAA